MPRIDPQQLLKTLGVLLAPSGGIKSSEEVVRIVTLMHKFSKKLVSKCIYVQILKATPPDLLDRFLEESGWSLLNQWFNDAVTTKNWPFTIEMIQLFAQCPISAERLRDNVEANQAPRLINQIRQEASIEEDVRSLATDVYNKWVVVVSPSKTATNGSSLDTTQASESSSDESKSSNNRLASKAAAASEDSKPENGSISLLASLAEEVSENIKKEESKVDVKKEEKDHHHKKDRHHHRDRDHHHSSSRSSKDKHHHSSRDKDRSSKSSSSSSKDKSRDKDRDDRKRRRDDKDRDKEKKRYRGDRRDEVDASEKQRIKEIARRLKEEEQSKKDKETLSKVGGVSSSSLSKIPKIPKKPVSDKGLSFEDMLGGLDQKPKTVKTPMNKNKTASLLEGLTKSSSSPSSKSKDHSSSKHSSSSHRKESSSSSSYDRHKSEITHRRDTSFLSKRDSPSSRHKHESTKPKLVLPPEPSKRRSSDAESPKSSKSPHNFSESNGFMEAMLSSMGVREEPKKKKRRLSETTEQKKDSITKALDSPTAVRSKPVTRGDTTKEEEEKKEKEEEPEKPAVFGFFKDTYEENEEEKEEEEKKDPEPEKMEEGSDNDNDAKIASPASKDGSESEKEKSDTEELPFEEPESMPREVKGILVYHRGRDKRNKSITWKAESNLVAVKYFEMDEDERVNVNKIKFENMRDMELKMEKAAIKSKDTMEEEKQNHWYSPYKIEVDNREAFVAGSNSQEKEVQYAREKNVLQALYFNKAMTPATPAEPDSENHARKEVVPIPLDDEENGDESVQDWTAKNNGQWPAPKVNQVDQQANLESAFSLPPALSNLLSSVQAAQGMMPQDEGNMSMEEQNMLMAQTEALKAMGLLQGQQAPAPMSFPPPGMPPPGIGGIPPGVPPPMAGPPFGGPPVGFNGPPPGFNGGPPPMGGPPPHGFGGGPGDFHGGGGGGGFRGGPGGGFNNRGFHNGRGRGGGGFGRGGFRDREFGKGRDFRGHDRAPPMEHRFKTRPCLYFQNGFCKDGDKCTFIHDQNNS